MTRLECSPPDCTLTLDEHEGEGHEFGNPCSNGCIHEDGHDTDTDYSQPHEWFQYSQDAVPGNPSCSGCQLPAENARHRGRYTATITLHSNDLDALTEEHDNLLAFFHEGEPDETLWISVTDPERS